MKNALLAILVLALVGGGIYFFMHRQSQTPGAQRERMVQEFLTVIPDSLGASHRREIEGLFEQLWTRYDRGLVAEADVDTIMTTMQDYIDRGAISGSDLVYYMAQVGYKTYSGEKKYRLPSGMVDHPVLNPRSALVDLFPDTSGYAEWLAERQRKAREDSLRNAAPR